MIDEKARLSSQLQAISWHPWSRKGTYRLLRHFHVDWEHYCEAFHRVWANGKVMVQNDESSRWEVGDTLVSPQAARWRGAILSDDSLRVGGVPRHVEVYSGRKADSCHDAMYRVIEGGETGFPKLFDGKQGQQTMS